MKIRVPFRDTGKLYSDYVLTYRLRDCSLTKKWLEAFTENFINCTHPIEKTFCMHGWLENFESTKGRSIKYLCEKLNQSISVINNDLNAKGYEYIDLFFDVESLKDVNKSRDLLNHVHHHFELLIGQTWSPSQWLYIAEQNTRDAIRSLNNICHELEHDLKCIRNNLHPPQVNISLNGKDFQGNYFQKKRIDISLENYKDFLYQSQWGTIVVYYSQLGKTFKEAYSDNDEYIKDSNISGHRYLTGEFVLSFGDRRPPSMDFLKWLVSKGLDPTDPTLAINHPVIGYLEGHLNKYDLYAELRRRDDLYKIELLDDIGDEICTKVFDYVWKDQDNL